jgi:hypothetical protein
MVQTTDLRSTVLLEAFQEPRMTGIHESLIVIDGLVISKWSRAVFADMRAED